MKTQKTNNHTSAQTAVSASDLGNYWPGLDYEEFYWKPFMSHQFYNFWRTLSALQRRINSDPDSNGRWPTISQIERMTGLTRGAIVGRQAYGNHPGQVGIIDQLAELQIIAAYQKGEGNGSRYTFEIHERLPLLTPAQAGKLPRLLQKDHRQHLKKSGLLSSWQGLTAVSLVKPLVWFA